MADGNPLIEFLKKNLIKNGPRPKLGLAFGRSLGDLWKIEHL